MVGIGAAVAGGIGLINNLISSRRSRLNNEKTNATNIWLAKYGYKKDLAQWQRENQYNHPSLQMDRLRQAGLNPNLVYGNGTVTGNTSGTGPKFNTPKAHFDQKPMQIPQMLGMYQDFKMKKAQIDNVQTTTDLVAEKRRNEEIKNGILINARDKGAIDLKYQPDLNEYSVQAKKKALEKQDVDISNAVKQGRISDQELKNKIQNFKNLKATEQKTIQDAVRQRLLNDWLEKGISPNDNIIFRWLGRKTEDIKQFFSDPRNLNPKGW